jgi:hypothetical protein
MDFFGGHARRREVQVLMHMMVMAASKKSPQAAARAGALYLLVAVLVLVRINTLETALALILKAFLWRPSSGIASNHVIVSSMSRL